MINQKEIEAWVLSLKIDKQYGIGVDGIYSDREKPQGIVNTTIDDILNDLDLMLISRALGEAVWEIDFKLYTRESLAKAEGEDFKNDADVTQYFDIEPYVPQDLDVLCQMNPIGQDIKDDDYTAKETEWYKSLREGFDNPTNKELAEIEELVKKECDKLGL